MTVNAVEGSERLSCVVTMPLGPGTVFRLPHRGGERDVVPAQ